VHQVSAEFSMVLKQIALILNNDLKPLLYVMLCCVRSLADPDLHKRGGQIFDEIFERLF